MMVFTDFLQLIVVIYKSGSEKFASKVDTAVAKYLFNFIFAKMYLGKVST